MISDSTSTLRRLPSVDEVLKTQTAASAVDRFGRPPVVKAVRAALEAARSALRADNINAPNVDTAPDRVAASAVAHLDREERPKVRPVINLTGTVLHTNLGRAVLAEEAIAAAVDAMRQTIALEFDLEAGQRGERDTLVRDLLCELTGAEDATVVNNNAAAVLLVLNTLAKRREVIVSRGELIEIGGAFRMPDVMAAAGAKLVEVGTTNRTHLHDYARALGRKTGVVLKVHPSNYRIEGFTAAVPGRDLAELAHSCGVPFVNDLGSGTLIDLTRFGLGHEPTVAEALAEGADVVTFSGDKLLGGPQSGFIVGRKELIARINRNPLKRALRVGKVRLAPIEATLRLYRDPDRLAQRLPTLRLLARPQAEIADLAKRLAPAVAAAVKPSFAVSVIECMSQIGSGALPRATVPSAGLAIRPVKKRGGGRSVAALASAFRALAIPVIGRVEDGAVLFDLRCLEDEAAFVESLAGFDLAGLDASSGKIA